MRRVPQVFALLVVLGVPPISLGVAHADESHATAASSRRQEGIPLPVPHVAEAPRSAPDLSVDLGGQTSHSEVSAAPVEAAYSQADAGRLDLLNLQEGFPTRVQDALVLPERAVEAQVSINVGHGDYYDTWTEARTQVAWGMKHDLQGIVGARFAWNDVDRTGHGDIYLQVLKQFAQTPQDAFLGGIKVNVPTGRDYARIDTSIPGFAFPIARRRERVDFWLTGVYTRNLDTNRPQRLHAQAQYGFINSAPLGINDRRWMLGLGYDRQLAPDKLAVASVWWEEKPSRLVGDSAALQLGLRQQQSRRFIWAASLDIGLGWEWADVGFTAAGQYGF